MGIRVHKVIGWGLDDLQCENSEIVDERIKTEDLWESQDDNNSRTFLKWLTDNKEKAIELLSDVNQESNPSAVSLNLIIHQLKEQDKVVYGLQWSEFSPHIMLFMPPDERRWGRCDDCIDYYEETASHGQEDRVQDLTKHCGIYPYIYMYRKASFPKDKNTLPDDQIADQYELVKNTYRFSRRYSPSVYNQLVGRWSDADPMATGETLQLLLDHYRPAIADSVILYTYFADIFTDWRKTVEDLRPMIYTYWC